MLTESIVLLTNGTATGPQVQWPGGRGVFTAAGNFSGATVALQMLGPDGATWFNTGTDTTLTSAGVGAFDLPPAQVRANVTGGPPIGMYAGAARVPV